MLVSESIAAAVDAVKRETRDKLDVLVNKSRGLFVASGLDTNIEQGKRFV